MPVPSYEDFMLPMLHVIDDREIHPVHEVREKLATVLNLSDEDKKELLPSGKMAVYRSRIGWAKTYLKNAGLIDNSIRGKIKITERGIQVLRSNPDSINKDFLMQFDEFQTFVNVTKLKASEFVVPNTREISVQESLSPEDMLENGYKEINNTLASDLLDQILTMSPDFFEKLVVELLVAMGYGGSLQEAGTILGKSGDGGIDGVIKMDKLGIDQIYIQAKRWDRSKSVCSPHIRDFIGALMIKGAKKGVFITTSSFTKDADGVAENPSFKVVLIDGKQLVDLMIEYNLGVSTSKQYTIKKIDSDYFLED